MKKLTHKHRKCRQCGKILSHSFSKHSHSRDDYCNVRCKEAYIRELDNYSREIKGFINSIFSV